MRGPNAEKIMAGFSAKSQILMLVRRKKNTSKWKQIDL
ncbi:hypothetical protein LEP1GSC193_0055 [Leptospira alstonii serovar Pingchang str. 80-412]|uniref:Uncharacterized protein n=2 Tax=Leptospira alstonii TaxID=28452 RepID=M6D238_9LEPT|nr:hypothetical protein LEP1GSC194_1007 [Leptospira alstonii serovar Sichuan str. 79601]EQA79103.1 hypothetical protein LEP1GSC193_0055 [Leptospira alstonii serovar Pingchang str. 80-412]